MLNRSMSGMRNPGEATDMVGCEYWIWMLDQYYLKGAELRDLTRTSSAFNVVAHRPGRPTFMLHAANMRHGEDTRRAQLRLHEVNCLSPPARPAFPDRSTFETNASDAPSDRDRSFFRAWFAGIAR